MELRLCKATMGRKKTMFMLFFPDTTLGMTDLYRSEWKERLGSMRQLSGWSQDSLNQNDGSGENTNAL